MRYCGKSRRGHRWQYNTANVRCLPDNYGCKYTHRICNIYCFISTRITLYYTNAPQCYVRRTLSVLFVSSSNLFRVRISKIHLPESILYFTGCSKTCYILRFLTRSSLIIVLTICLWLYLRNQDGIGTVTNVRSVHTSCRLCDLRVGIVQRFNTVTTELVSL